MKIFYTFIIVNTFLNLAIGQTDIKQNLVIGDHFGGGIIFYIDPTGKHGLIAAPFDQPQHAWWAKEGWTGANYMNDGVLNTKRIVSFMKEYYLMSWEGIPAACICDTSTLGGYRDWYLPSINELKDMYDKQEVIGNFIAEDYCSSTEKSRGACWNIHFKPQRKIVFHYFKSLNIYKVRCIRKI